MYVVAEDNQTGKAVETDVVFIADWCNHTRSAGPCHTEYSTHTDGLRLQAVMLTVKVPPVYHIRWWQTPVVVVNAKSVSYRQTPKIQQSLSVTYVIFA